MGLFDFLKTKEVVPYEEIYKELDIFTATSLAMPKMNNPFLLDDKSKQPTLAPTLSWHNVTEPGNRGVLKVPPSSDSCMRVTLMLRRWRNSFNSIFLLTIPFAFH